MSNSHRVDGASIDKALLAVIVLCLVLQAWLALVMEINWDEFYYLSQIYSYQRGDLAAALQMFHVHLLGWLTSIPGNEIDQIVAGRFVMLSCEVGTCGLIYRLSRLFTSRTPALLAVLAFASAAFTIIHGASFRTDPLATLLMMGSLVIIARARPGIVSAAGAAACAAVAAMVTVKVVLYAPTFLGVAAWRIARSEDRRSTILWFGGTAVAAAAAFAMLYLVQLALVPEASDAAARAGMGNAAQTLFGAGFLPRLGEIRQFLLLSPVGTILLVAGFASAVAMLARSRWEAIAVLGCGTTLLCLLFYRNAFPYFFPFILAPAAILVACAVGRVGFFARHPMLLAIGLVVPAMEVAYVWSAHGQRTQRQVVAEVHRIFPQPVAYIDRNGMIASFPKRGFFMSTWGMQNYRRAEAPVFERLLAEDTVPLVIANGPALQSATGEIGRLPDEISLFDEDVATLRANYIPHWGPLWVAGKRLRVTREGTPFEIAVPGTYTVEGASAWIDGRPVRDRGTILLARGVHVVRANTERSIVLRWGTHLLHPAELPAAEPIYRGF